MSIRLITIRKSMKKYIHVAITCLGFSFMAIQADAQISFGISISARIAPPPLPVYAQPPCPTDGFLWTPGYWAYTDDGYFWTPGVWVRPPQIGYLWTPSYWGYSGGYYGWHSGYWGTHVGFYGGVNYGYGYGGSGYGGGMWQGGGFHYNTAVTNVNTTVIRNTYVNNTVINNTTIVNNRTSFNGGPGGLAARPNAQEQMAVRETHVQPTGEQINHQQAMRQDRNQFASVNHGHPATMAMNHVNGQRFDKHGHPAMNQPAMHTQSNQGQIHPRVNQAQTQSLTNHSPAAYSNPATHQQSVSHPAPTRVQPAQPAASHPQRSPEPHEGEHEHLR